MRLKVLLPTEIAVNEKVTKISVWMANTSFTLLPRHIDMGTLLTPGILSFHVEGEADHPVYLAIDEGILVKRGPLVQVSSRNAVRGDDVDVLRATITREFHELDERERKARSALVGLETDLIRRFIELGEW